MRLGGQVVWASLVAIISGSIDIGSTIILPNPLGPLNRRCEAKYEVELLKEVLAGMAELKRRLARSGEVNILQILDHLKYNHKPQRQAIRQRLARLLGDLYVTESSLSFLLELNRSGGELTSSRFHSEYNALPAFEGKGTPGSYQRPSNCQLQRWYKQVLEPYSGMTLSAAGIRPIMKIKGENVYAPSVSDMLVLCDMEMRLMIPRLPSRKYKKRKIRDSLDSSPETSVESRMDDLAHEGEYGRFLPIASAVEDTEWDFLDIFIDGYDD